MELHDKQKVIWLRAPQGYNGHSQEIEAVIAGFTAHRVKIATLHFRTKMIRYKLVQRERIVRERTNHVPGLDDVLKEQETHETTPGSAT